MLSLTRRLMIYATCACERSEHCHAEPRRSFRSRV